MKILFGFGLGLAIGAASRWFEIPVPAPPRLIGALLVVSITVGYMLTDRWLVSRSAPERAAQIGSARGGKP
jgi:XapX domain-containing protein